MDQERFRKIRRIFNEAIERSPEERSEFVREGGQGG